MVESDRPPEAVLKDAPESPTILARLSLLNFILNRTEEGVSFGLRALEINPGDVETLRRMVAYYVRTEAGDSAEKLFKKVLADPKLSPVSIARLLIQHELGLFHARNTGNLEAAADAWTFVVNALGEKAANLLSASEQRDLFGDDPAAAYLTYGRLLLNAKRYEAAVKALQRGLTYETDSVGIPIALGEALLALGKPEEALAIVESMLKRQPIGNEGYDLLARTLKQLHREAEILPRLDAASKADSRNLNLQFALSQEYRRQGNTAEADRILKDLLEKAPDPQAYAALASSLLRDKKTDQLILLLTKAISSKGPQATPRFSQRSKRSPKTQSTPTNSSTQD